MKKPVVNIMILCLCFISFIISGCSQQHMTPREVGKEQTILITDSIGRRVEIAYPVTRVVVSNTYNAELINAIGGLNKVVGVDYYIYQDKESFRHQFTKDMIIGHSQGELNYEKIIELNPQVVILTSNGSWQEATEKLQPFGIAVVNVDSYCTNQFENNMAILGEIFGTSQKAKEVSNFFISKLTYIDKQLKGIPKRSVYFEYRALGRTTIPGDYFFNMVSLAHGDNIFKYDKSKNIDLEAVVQKNPQYIVKVSSTDVYSSYIPPTTAEQDKIKQAIINRPGWADVDAVKNDNILLLSHYVHGGASKLIGTMYIAKFMYPEYLPDLHPEDIFKTWLTKFQGLEYKAGHTLPLYQPAS